MIPATLLLLGSVWVLDDGEKVKEDAAAVVDALGPKIELAALADETIAFQIVVHADDASLAGVTVDVAAPGVRVERFVEHFVEVRRASGGKDPKESLGWVSGSGPSTRFTGWLPDALIPVESAPAWRPYPMAIARQRNGIVWVDLTVSRMAGVQRGEVKVRAGDRILATFPIEVRVVPRALPERPLRTMLYYESSNLEKRTGSAETEHALWRLLRKHRLTPLHAVTSPEDLDHHRAALDGTFYAKDYDGPGPGNGDGVLAIGMYGDLGKPDAEKLETVLAIGDRLGPLLATTDTFVYAKDEDCTSPWGPAWKKLLDGSRHAKRIRVAWTCSEDPTKQGVDIAIQLGTFDPARTAKARAMGKEVWIYNGQQPHTGSFHTDAPAITPRVNGWIQATNDIGRWFYWEVGFWYDGNRGGRGPYDPFVTAETFHNADGDWGVGDGVLVYPGKQVDRFQEHSIGIDGVLPSIRLKNWRRGIEDAGYYQLAHAVDAARAEAVAKELLPAVLDRAKEGKPASWSEAGKPWREARARLLAIIEGGAAAAVATSAPPAPVPAPKNGCSRGCNEGPASNAPGAVLALALALVLTGRRRARER